MSLAPFLAQTKHPECDLVAFRFQVTAPAGTDDPDFLFPGYQGISNVTRVSEGLYEITFEYKYRFMLACFCGVQAAVGDTDGIQGQVISYDAATGKLRVSTVAPAITDVPTVKDPADDAWVHVLGMFARKDSFHAVVAI